MSSDNFFLVPQIVAGEKYFDVSVAEMLRALEGMGRFDADTEHIALDEYGGDHAVVLRLNVNCQSRTALGWTVSLKLHKTRIDGLDWEPKYTSAEGAIQVGWHRHEWEQRKQSAEQRKIPAPDLNGINSREQFLIRSFSLMRISVSTTDYGDQLSFTQNDFT